MADVTNTGARVFALIEGEAVEFRDLMQTPPVSLSPASMKVRQGMNPVATAFQLYGNAEDWWKLLVFNPDIMYPLDLDKHVGERLPIVEV